MSVFQLNESNAIPEESKPILENVKNKFGFVPNLMKVFAQAPVALKSYLAVSEIFDTSSFTPTERQLILLSVSIENSCQYCSAVHSTIAKNMVKVEPKIVNDLRGGIPLSNSKYNHLVTFTRLLIKERGFVSDEATQKFLDAGYSRQNILEVVTAIGLKTISNYVNHLAKTPIDDAFAAEQ